MPALTCGNRHEEHPGSAGQGIQRPFPGKHQHRDRGPGPLPAELPLRNLPEVRRCRSEGAVSFAPEVTHPSHAGFRAGLGSGPNI